MLRAVLVGISFPAGGIIAGGAEIALTGRSSVFPGLLGLQTLDGKVDFAVFVADDDNLHILTLGQVLTDVTDIGIGHFRDMYHTGLVLRQSDECSEIGDRLDFSFQNGSDG